VAATICPRPVTLTFDLEVGVGVACAKMLRIDAFVDADDSFCFTSLLISVMMSDSSHCQSRN